jgi:hypothetical protein
MGFKERYLIQEAEAASTSTSTPTSAESKTPAGPMNLDNALETKPIIPETVSKTDQNPTGGKPMIQQEPKENTDFVTNGMTFNPKESPNDTEKKQRFINRLKNI